MLNISRHYLARNSYFCQQFA